MVFIFNVNIRCLSIGMEKRNAAHVLRNINRLPWFTTDIQFVWFNILSLLNYSSLHCLNPIAYSFESGHAQAESGTKEPSSGFEFNRVKRSSLVIFPCFVKRCLKCNLLRKSSATHSKCVEINWQHTLFVLFSSVLLPVRFGLVLFPPTPYCLPLCTPAFFLYFWFCSTMF